MSNTCEITFLAMSIPTILTSQLLRSDGLNSDGHVHFGQNCICPISK